MIVSKLRIFIIIMIFISILSCRSKESDQLYFSSIEKKQDNDDVAENKNVDQWFFDEYTDGKIVPYNFEVDYHIITKIENQETKDLIKYICIWGYKTGGFSSSKLLEFSNLEVLKIVNSNIYSLDIFSEIKSLKVLYIIDYTSYDKTRDIKYNLSHLSGLSQLERLDFLLDENFEIDFSGIENLPALKAITFHNYEPYRIRNVDNLINATELEILDLSLDNGDISFLRNMTKLEVLALYNRNGYDLYNDQRIKKDYYLDIDLKAVRGSIFLEKIDLFGFTIKNIEIINELQNLKEVDIIDCYLDPNNDYTVIPNRIRLRSRYFDVG